MIVNIEKTAEEQRNSKGRAHSPALQAPRNPTPNAGRAAPTSPSTPAVLGGSKAASPQPGSLCLEKTQHAVFIISCFSNKVGFLYTWYKALYKSLKLLGGITSES